MATVGRNARGQVTINGVARFIRLIYDSGFAGTTAADVAGHLVARNLGRFAGKFNVYLNYMFGTIGNGLRLCDALDAYDMYGLAVGNAFGGATVEQMSAANGNFDLVTNATYDGTAFRTAFAAKARSGGNYLSDEVSNTTALRDNVVAWHSTYRAAMPALPTLSVFYQYNAYQALDFMPYAIGEWVGYDPYPVGFSTELNPGSPDPPAVSTYGYMNFTVGEAAALASYHALANGKSPIVILQAFKAGTTSRYISNAEMWSHMVAVVTELKGVGGIGWWALGVGDGALDSSTMDPTERERILTQLDAMTTLLASLESVLLSSPNPALLPGNSLATGNAITWRQGLVNVLRNGAADRPCWDWWSGVVRFEDEYTRMQSGDYSLSNHMLDQSAHVRTCAWQSGGTGYVFAYNVHPDAQVCTLTWNTNVSRVEVLGESRDVTVTAGRSWTDTYGGASSLRQGAFRQGHIYRLTITASAYAVPADTYAYSLTGSPATCFRTAGPTTIGLVHRR